MSTSFVVPSSMSVAYHTLIATQTNNGVAVSGTPGRTSFQVTSVAAAASSASMFTPVTTIGLLAMAAAGSVMQVVRRRRQTVEA